MPEQNRLIQTTFASASPQSSELAFTIPAGTLLPADFTGLSYHGQVFADSLSSARRRKVAEVAGFPIMYEGGWHYQGESNSCATWAIVHGVCAAGGGPVDDNWMRDMLAFSEGKPGVLIADLLGMNTAQFPEGVVVREKRILPELHAEDEYILPLVPYFGLLEILRSGVAEQKSEAGFGLLVHVRAKDIYRSDLFPADEHHIVCVGGVRQQNGCIDVQIIDSGGEGIYWCSLEHLARSMNPYTASYLFSRSN